MLYYTSHIMTIERPEPPLPCPKCRQRLRLKGRALMGANRIGNRRTECDICNNFAQNVMRITSKRLKQQFIKEYEQIRALVEMDLYPQVIADWNAAHPEIRSEDIKLDDKGMVK